MSWSSSRCSDRAPAVRAKALSQFALLITSDAASAIEPSCLQTALGSVRQQVEVRASSVLRWLWSIKQNKKFTAGNFLFFFCSPSHQTEAGPQQKLTETISTMIKRRLTDSKGLVRKAAVTAMEGCILMLGKDVAGEQVG